MDIFFESKKRITAVIIAGLGCLAMVIFPQISLLSAQKALALWAGNVLPALLPFFICINFMNHMGVTKVLKPSAFAFVMSVMSGYPMGAKIIGDMCREGRITERQAKRMLRYCSTSGPSFMIGAVGAGLMGSVKAGAIIAVSHYLGAVANGLFGHIIGDSEDRVAAKTAFGHERQASKSKSIMDLFTEATISSFKSMGIILAYLVIFMFLTDLLQFAGVFTLLKAPFAKALAKGIIEMTVGSAALAGCIDMSLASRTVLITAVISWGGISVIGQTMSMLSGTNISIVYFMSVKLFHCMWAVLIAMIFCGMLLT